MQPPEPAGIKFPSVSTVGSPYETPAPRSVRESRTTSLTPSDSASNVPINYFYGNGAVPGTIAGPVDGPPLPESTVSKKSKKDKNRSLLSTIMSNSNSTAKPSTEQPPPPEPASPVPQISIPASPSVSSSLGGSRLTTNPNTPINTRSLKSSLASSLSYATDHPEPPLQPATMSRQNSDSVIPGGLGSTLGGVLTGVWGAYKSTNASPTVENPPGPATAAYEATLETIEDVEVPGGFGGERESEVPVLPQEVIPEPIVIPPSPPKLEMPEPAKVPTPKVEIPELPASEPAPPEPETEIVPPTPNEPEQSAISAADRKKTKRQRDKERREKEAQDKKEREERERIEREAQEARDREDREEKKRQERASREAKKERERIEQEEREAQEKRAREEQEERKKQEKAAEREARKKEQERQEQERIEREAQAERAAREQAEREAKEQAAREAKEQAEREAQEQAREKMDRVARKKAEKEAAKQEAEKIRRETKERADEAVRVKAEEDRKRREKEAKEQAERVEKEKAKQEAFEKAAQEAREKAKLEAAEKAEQKEKERADQLKAEEEARKKAEREEQEKMKREEERLEREREEAREKANREAKEREEEEKKKFTTSKTPSAWGSTIGKNNDRPRKTSGLSQKEQKNEWGGAWDFNSTEQKDEPSGLPHIITASVPGSIFNGAGNMFAKNDSPGGAGEEVELHTPLTKKGKNGISTPSNLSKVATPSETVDMDKLELLDDLGLNNMSARVSISSENERFTDAEQGPSPPELAHPALTPEIIPEAFSNSTSELLKTPQAVKEEVPTTPKPWSPSSFTPTQPQVSTPPPAPANTEPEKPLSLWERKKLKGTNQPSPASNLSEDGAKNTPSVWGNVGGGESTETIAMPAITGTGDRQSIFTDTARDQKRENQRENLVEGFLGSSQRRRNDSVQSQMTTKPTPKSTPVIASSPAQKSSGWGSWGSSLLNNIAQVVTVPDRSPSPELPPVKPKIEDPPRGFTPNQPPKSQPAGFGPSNKPGWSSAAGPGDNPWGGAKNSSTPIVQKTPAVPAWGAKPVGGGFNTGTTTWGNPTSSTFGSGINKNLTVNTMTKPPESGPNTAGPENIPESAVEIKHVPAPGAFHSSITDNKEDVRETQDNSWGWDGDVDGKDQVSKGDSKPPSPADEKGSEQQAEEIEEPARAEETVIPAEEDDLESVNNGKKKKKGQVSSVAQTPSVPNTPDLDNADEGAATGGGKKKKKKGGRR